MFRKLFERKAHGEVAKKQPLTGAPAVRRLKTYSADSGYVYQYAYEGQRPYGSGTEFVFTISADRKSWHGLSVIVNDEAVRAWEHSSERRLSSTEWYAVAKIALYTTLDEGGSPAEMRAAIHVGEDGVVKAAERLGFVE